MSLPTKEYKHYVSPTLVIFFSYLLFFFSGRSFVRKEWFLMQCSMYKEVHPATLCLWRGIIELGCAQFLHCGGLMILSYMLTVWFHIHGGECNLSGAKRLSQPQGHNFKDAGIKLWWHTTNVAKSHCYRLVVIIFCVTLEFRDWQCMLS